MCNAEDAVRQRMDRKIAASGQRTKGRIMYISLATWRCPDAFQEFDGEFRDALRSSLITMTLSPRPDTLYFFFKFALKV